MTDDRKREAARLRQRKRREKLRRIDYYPSEKAAAVLDQLWHHCVGGDYSSVISRLIEKHWQPKE